MRGPSQLAHGLADGLRPADRPGHEHVLMFIAYGTSMVWPASILLLVVAPVTLAFAGPVRMRWLIVLGALVALSFWIAFGWLSDVEKTERGKLVFVAGWLAVLAFAVWLAGALLGSRARRFRAGRRARPGGGDSDP